MSTPTRKRKPCRECWIFAAAVALINLPWMLGSDPGRFVFYPQLVLDGEWWRVLTHPFLHVSWYHLLLDASAFFILYNGLDEPRPLKRISYVAICVFGSLGIALMTAPAVATLGLCGLSAAAHGLMVISALEMMTSSSRKHNPGAWRTGVVCFVIVTVKAAIEAVSGSVLFASLHLGNVGTPIASFHAGGVLAGLLAFVFLNPARRRSPANRNQATICG